MTEVYFKDGTFVEKEAKLFQIDPRQYKAEWDRAVGSVDQIRATKRARRNTGPKPVESSPSNQLGRARPLQV